MFSNSRKQSSYYLGQKRCEYLILNSCFTNNNSYNLHESSAWVALSVRMTHASVQGLVNGKKVMHCGHILRSCRAKLLKKKVRLGWVPGSHEPRIHSRVCVPRFLGTRNPGWFRVPENGNPGGFRVPGKGNPNPIPLFHGTHAEIYSLCVYNGDAKVGFAHRQSPKSLIPGFNSVSGKAVKCIICCILFISNRQNDRVILLMKPCELLII
jgi:hypothetical protein